MGYFIDLKIILFLGMDKTFVGKINYMANWNKIAAIMLDEYQIEITLDDKNVHSTSCWYHVLLNLCFKGQEEDRSCNNTMLIFLISSFTYFLLVCCCSNVNYFFC